MEITILISGDLNVDNAAKMNSLKCMSTYGDREFLSQNLLELLFGLFGITNEQKKDLPVAAITALADLQNSSDQIWLRADPVIMKADMTSLRLFDSRHFSLEKKVAMKIISRLNKFLEGDGLQIICGEDPQRWYIPISSSPKLRTTAPSIANGQDIRDFLPEGHDRKVWRVLMSEIQMFLFDFLNHKTQEKSPINSVWFWGTGDLPKPITCQFDSVISNDVNAIGLAQWANIPCQSLTESFQDHIEQCQDDKKILIVLSQDDLALSCFDPFKQAMWLSEMEKNVFNPIFRLLKKGKVKSIKLNSADQYCSIKPIHLFRFWRKKNLCMSLKTTEIK